MRHAGLLGIKYEVAVRSDLVDKAQAEDGKKILCGVVEAAVLGCVLFSCGFFIMYTKLALLYRLGDYDDDVRAVAASCLLPVTSHLVQQLPEHLGRVLDVLWNCLAEMKDDLSSSVGAVMELLGASYNLMYLILVLIPYLGQLVSFDEVIQILGDPAAS